MTALLATSANGVHSGPYAISVSTTRWRIPHAAPSHHMGGIFVDRDEVAMPEQTRAARNLAEDITHANNQLKRARQDGSCDQIMFWTKRVNELLERWPVVTAQQQPQGSAHT